MTAALLLGTIFFAVLGAVGAGTAGIWAKKSEGLGKVLAPLCAFCMWLSWALIYMAQMNPLIFPTRNIKKE